MAPFGLARRLLCAEDAAGAQARMQHAARRAAYSYFICLPRFSSRRYAMPRRYSATLILPDAFDLPRYAVFCCRSGASATGAAPIGRCGAVRFAVHSAGVLLDTEAFTAADTFARRRLFRPPLLAR